MSSIGVVLCNKLIVHHIFLQSDYYDYFQLALVNRLFANVFRTNIHKQLYFKENGGKGIVKKKKYTVCLTPEFGGKFFIFHHFYPSPPPVVFVRTCIHYFRIEATRQMLSERPSHPLLAATLDLRKNYYNKLIISMYNPSLISTEVHLKVKEAESPEEHALKMEEKEHKSNRYTFKWHWVHGFSPSFTTKTYDGRGEKITYNTWDREAKNERIPLLLDYFCVPPQECDKLPRNFWNA